MSCVIGHAFCSDGGQTVIWGEGAWVHLFCQAIGQTVDVHGCQTRGGNTFLTENENVVK